MKAIVWCMLALTAACSRSNTEPEIRDPDPFVAGPLSLAVKDFPTSGGIMFALPSITPSKGAVVVENTQYGSLCQFSVAGNAQVQPTKIELHVGFAELFTVCTADVRALKYTATISAPAGTYDVWVIHHQNGQADTLRKQTVVVP